MNALLIKSVIFSEGPDTLETAENSGAVLVLIRIRKTAIESRKHRQHGRH